MSRAKLALAIPTLGRAETLEHILRAILDEARTLGVPIHISDDAPDDEETKQRVARLAEIYPDIHYQRNDPTLGHDANLIKTLGLPEADHVWLLADSLQIKPGELTAIHDQLDGEDFLFLNAIVSNEEAARYIGAPPQRMIIDLMWNLALTGATIYHRRVIDWLQTARPEIKRNFPHLSIILGFASDHEVKADWVPRKVMISLPKKSYWRARSVFQNWVDDWSAVVTDYPRLITPDERQRAFQCHARGTGIFSVANLLRFRAEGQFDRQSTRRPHFRDVVPQSQALITALLLIPRPLAAASIAARRRLLGRTNDIGHG